MVHWNSPEEDGSPWTILILAGKRLPGFARVDVSLPSGLDIRKRRGKRGGFVKDEGDPPRRLKARLQIFTPEDLLLLDDFRDLLISGTVSGARDPLTIQHPLANFLGIHTVVLGDAEFPQPDDLWEISFDMVEWLPEAADANKQSDVDKQKAKAKAEEDAWAPFRDDGVAGSGAPPAEANAAHDNLPDPRAG